jgi:hypothetical protein
MLSANTPPRTRARHRAGAPDFDSRWRPALDHQALARTRDAPPFRPLSYRLVVTYRESVFFERVLISDGEVVGTILASPFAELLADDLLHGLTGPQKTRKAPRTGLEAQGSHSERDPDVFSGPGSKEDKMAGQTGRYANPAPDLDRLFETLVDPAGREARGRAAGSHRNR